MKNKLEIINVTKTFLPPIEKYIKYIENIWSSDKITNQGPLLKELECKLEDHLSVKNLHFVNNGTTALQLALKALDIIDGEIITTPFSYVATTSAILWERCKPVFIDIDPDNFCIDPGKIEEKITKKTKAILAVHVFGIPCDVEKIEEIAKKNNLRVIYDGAHAFGVNYKGKSLLSYGDISVCSFHATKIFHTVEGGCLIVKNEDVSKRLELLKRFGHQGDEHHYLGINAKASELHAAMGLCNLEYIDKIVEKRKEIFEKYNQLLNNFVKTPGIPKNITYNYSYYPIIFKNEAVLLNVLDELNRNDIYPRRYFYPSINTLSYIGDKQICPISEDISSRVLCLPFYYDLKNDTIEEISEIIIKTIKKSEH